MRTLIVIVGAAVVLAGCSRDEPSQELPDVFTVAISDQAASASRKAGVDLEALLDRSARRVFELLPYEGRVRIEVELDASTAIPEVGIGGFTDPGTGDVSLSIDDTPPGGLKTTLDTWLPALLAHELHHSSRIRTGPGYGTTLGEALVTQGLADHFAAEAFPGTPPQPWDNALSKAQENEAWRRAQPVLHVPSGYDHQAWFFGGGGLPRWGGYTLGYRIAQAYLGHSRTASDAVGVAGEIVIESYASTRTER